jgi:hypothetical protein
MDILQNIDTNVSSMVSSSFDEFISTKVKEAVEKEKEKFLTDLNMCEEEYPFNKDIHEFMIEGLSFPVGYGHYYITNLGNIYNLPHDSDKNYRHPHMLNPPKKPESIIFRGQSGGRKPAIFKEYKPVKLNNEYIEILKLLAGEPAVGPRIWSLLLIDFSDIYSKYHPRASENFVIEEKLKKLTQIEKVVEERVEEERNDLEKQKEIYLEKIKQVNEEKLKRIFYMFILHNERKENIKDKSTIREMIKHSNDKCKKKEQEQETMLEKHRQDLKTEKEEFERQKEVYETELKVKAKSLLDIANDINEINELQDDTLCKSEELFKLMKQLNEIK